MNRRLNKGSIFILTFILIIGFQWANAQNNTTIVDWGDNTYAQLLSSFEDRNITAISTGYEHSLAIVDESSVIAWGSNNYGQLDVPSGILNPIKVVAGLGHSVVLQADSTLVAWGYNDFGQINVSGLTGVIDVAVGDEHTIALHSNGTLTLIASGTTHDLTVPSGLSNVKAIASGNFHMVVLLQDNTVVAWGDNEFGQASVPVGLIDVQAVDAGLYHSLALKTDGTLVGWGDNSSYGQIDVPSGTDTFEGINVGDYHNVALNSVGEIKLWGADRFTESQIPTVLTDRVISLITAGFAHNTVVASNLSPVRIVAADTILVNEDVEKKATLLTLDTEDADTIDEHIYEFTSGVGNDDNSSFELVSLNHSLNRDDLLWGKIFTLDIVRNTVEFDYEQDSIYTTRLKSTDIGGLSIEQQIVFKIQNVYEEPEALTLSNKEVDEREPLGTLVGSFSTEDPDLYDSFTYTLVAGNGSQDNDHFTIIGNTLQTSKIFIENEQSTHVIRVRSTDLGGFMIEESFAIAIIPINEEPTAITLSNQSIKDNLELGSLLGFFETTDPDPEDNHTYVLTAGDGDEGNDAFTITGNTLLTNLVFDALAQDSFSIRVRSTDDGKPDSLFFEQIFVLSIISTNELPEISDQMFSIKEDVDDEAIIGIVVASDDGDFTYNMLSGNIDEVFSLDESVGTLSVAQSKFLNANAIPNYDLAIEVEDEKGLTSQAIITVTVIQVAESPVMVDQFFEIAETANIGALVGNMIASSPKENALTFSLLSGDPDGLFQVSSEGTISLAQDGVLNAIDHPTYLLTLQVLDQEQALSVEAIAHISVLDVNEMPEDISLSSSQMLDAQPVSTIVGFFETTDPDPLDDHAYVLTSGVGDKDNDAFAIAGNTLLTNLVFDALVQDSYSIRVRSTDDGKPDFLFFEEIFVISIVSANESPKISDQMFSVKENVDDETLIGIIVASDDGDFTYNILSGNIDEAFSLDESIGRLSVAQSRFLDANVIPNYELEIEVEDEKGLTAQATISIAVIEVKESPVMNDQFFEVAENASFETIVGLVIAESPKGNDLIFTVNGGSGEGVFSLNSNGQIVLVDPVSLDARRTPSYDLLVTVTDSDEQLSESATAIIRVVDVNLAPTSLFLDNTIIDEQKPVGLSVGLWSTEDADFGDEHIYELVEGIGDKDNEMFQVDDEELKTAIVLDARIHDELNIRVRTTDNGSPNKWFEQELTIKVVALELPEISSAITPNGDGQNDVWEIPNLDIYPECKVSIMDRFGQQVYSSTGYRNSFDGTFKGKKLPVASYYYVIQLNNIVNTEYSGIITILR